MFQTWISQATCSMKKNWVQAKRKNLDHQKAYLVYSVSLMISISIFLSTRGRLRLWELTEDTCTMAVAMPASSLTLVDMEVGGGHPLHHPHCFLSHSYLLCWSLGVFTKTTLERKHLCHNLVNVSLSWFSLVVKTTSERKRGFHTLSMAGDCSSSAPSLARSWRVSRSSWTRSGSHLCPWRLCGWPTCTMLWGAVLCGT